MADNPGNGPAPAAEPAQEQDDFTAAFAERTGREEEKPEASEPKDDTPPAPAEEAAKEPAAAEAQFDPWDGLTDGQKSYFEGLKHSESSNRGRVASLNRQLSELRAAGQPPADQQPKEQDDSKPKDEGPSRADRMKAAAEEYPDAVGVLVEEIVDLQARLEKLTPQAPAEQPAPDEAAMEKEYEALEKAHPDYRTIGADPSYASWVSSKPKEIQALANSYAAGDVASVLTLFKAERQASMASPEAKTDTTAQRRERQLEGSRAVASRGAPTSSGPAADDFSAAFAARAAQKR